MLKLSQSISSCLNLDIDKFSYRSRSLILSGWEEGELTIHSASSHNSANQSPLHYGRAEYSTLFPDASKECLRQSDIQYGIETRVAAN